MDQAYLEAPAAEQAMVIFSAGSAAVIAAALDATAKVTTNATQGAVTGAALTPSAKVTTNATTATATGAANAATAKVVVNAGVAASDHHGRTNAARPDGSASVTASAQAAASTATAQRRAPRRSSPRPSWRPWPVPRTQPSAKVTANAGVAAVLAAAWGVSPKVVATAAAAASTGAAYDAVVSTVAQDIADAGYAAATAAAYDATAKVTVNAEAAAVLAAANDATVSTGEVPVTTTWPSYRPRPVRKRPSVIANAWPAAAFARAHGATTSANDDEWVIETLLGFSDAALVGALDMDTIREYRVASDVWPDADFEIRATTDGLNFRGYAAVFDSKSEDLGGFRETIAPGSFSRTLAEKGRSKRSPIKMFLNHDWNVVLASTYGNEPTLRLAEDARGLFVDADLPDNEWGRPGPRRRRPR